MATKKKKLTPYEERLKKILKQVSGDISNIEGDLIPPLTIKGNGIIYCYQPSTREFVKVCRGSNVYLVREEDLAGKVLIYTFEGQIVEVDVDELSLEGFD